MKQRKVHVPAVVDWHWMGQTGLMEGIEPYLEKAFNSIHGQFVCMGVETAIWNSGSRVQGVSHQVYGHSFFAQTDVIFVEDDLSFWLGGERHTLILVDFALRTQIYLLSKVHSKAYQQYITGYVRVTEGFKAEAYWNEIENGSYDKGITQESDIRSPLHRLLHRLIINAINQR